jgi:hypothetical protein
MNGLLPRDTELHTLVQHPREFVVRYRPFLLILLLGASADLFTTLWNLRQYGTSIEVHLPQRLLGEWFGVEIGVPLAKIIQLAFVLLVAAWWKPWCRWILLACGILYALAAMNNHFLWL